MSAPNAAIAAKNGKQMSAGPQIGKHHPTTGGKQLPAGWFFYFLYYV